MINDLMNDVSRVLCTQQQLKAEVKRLGIEISRDYEGRQPILVSVLKGAFVFMADVVREITVPGTIDFMSVSSYGSSTESSGRVKIIKDLDTNIENRDVIIVEDILDSGVTLSKLIELLKSRNPSSLAVCTLFDKPDRRKAYVAVDYRGITVPDEFVVGYGLDYDEKYRNLPDLCVLKPEIYTK